MTANAYNEDILKAREAGMNAHIAKPINIEEVVQKIDAQIDGRTDVQIDGRTDAQADARADTRADTRAA